MFFGTLSQFVDIKKAFGIVAGATVTVQFLAMLRAFALRIDHLGRVCSGDYLEVGADKTGYLYQQGTFIKNTVAFMALTFVMVASVALFAITGAFRRKH